MLVLSEPCTKDVCPPGTQGIIGQCYKPCPHNYIDEGLLCRKKKSIKTIMKKHVNTISYGGFECQGYDDENDGRASGRG